MAKPYRPYKLTLGFSDKEILEIRKGLFTEINKQAEDIKKVVGQRFLDLPGGHLEKFDDIKELKEAANRLANFIAQQEAVLSGDFNQDYHGDE